jgi:hypothetical protein
MSHKWIRASHPLHCGHCHTRIERNTLVLTITLPSARAVLLRCTQCAAERAPDDIPDLPPDAPTTDILDRIRAIAARFTRQHPLDFKARQTKD